MLYNTTKLVKELLIADEAARNNDRYLFQLVHERWYPGISDMRYGFVLEHLTDFGLPTFETIRRARQKIQHDYPYLGPTDAVKEKRESLEAEYFDFALSEIDV